MRNLFVYKSDNSKTNMENADENQSINVVNYFMDTKSTQLVVDIGQYVTELRECLLN